MEEQAKELKEENISLEDHFRSLEDQISRLEKPDISLEEAFELYKNGLDEIKEVREQLDAMEQTMLIMNSDGSLEEFE